MKIMLMGNFLQKLEHGKKDVFCFPFNLNNKLDRCLYCGQVFKKYAVVIRLSCRHIIHPICLSKRDQQGSFSCPLCEKEEDETQLQFMIHDPDEDYWSSPKIFFNKPW
jgi:hypothetical protein